MTSSCCAYARQGRLRRLRQRLQGVSLSGDGSYTFTVGEQAELAASVGTVSATGLQGDRVIYAITAGNEHGTKPH